MMLAPLVLSAQITVSDDGSVGVGLENTDDYRKVIVEYGYSTYGVKVLSAEYTGSGNYSGIAVHRASFPSNNYGYGGFFEASRIGVYGMATVTGGTTRYGTYGRAGNGSSVNHGLYGYAHGTSGTKYAVFGYAHGDSGTSKYGIFGKAEGSGGAKYGVYGTATGSGTNWAGYFQGNVYVTGTLTQASDGRLKRNIQEMDRSENLGRLRRLRAIRYRFKPNQELNQEGFGGLDMPQQEQLGFLAQEMQEEFPELVQEVIHHQPPAEAAIPPDELTEEDLAALAASAATEVRIKTINYQGLIPVLVGALQEQQAQIETLQAQVRQLQQRGGQRSGNN